jgi:uncharacterized FAD-dependent dehydrogenase
MYDVVIIGAGPGGMGASYSLLRGNNLLLEAGTNRYHNRCVVSKTTHCNKCIGGCDTVSGFGGSFAPFHASKLSFPPSGKRLAKIIGDEEYLRVSKEVWNLYKSMVNKSELEYPTINKDIQKLESSAMTLVKYPVHVATESEHTMFLDSFYDTRVQRKNLDVLINSSIDLFQDINMKDKTIKAGRCTIGFNDIFIATGRQGYKQTQYFFDVYGVKRKHENINFGVRYMVPSKYLNQISELHPDFKMKFKTEDYELETFCFSNSINGGKVDFLRYDDFLNIDGHIAVETEGDKIENVLYGNFAILYENCKQNISFKDFVHRINDMKVDNFTRCAETFLSFNNHSLLSRFFSKEEYKAIIDFSMEVFDFMAKINNVNIKDIIGETFVYGPEVENIWGEIETDSSFKVANNIYAIGDCTGLAQGIVSAMVMGYKAGEMYSKTLGSH